jgi:EAL domain-containing protein (putative c-di-GMP-specific phosphodiesterase class I)
MVYFAASLVAVAASAAAAFTSRLTRDAGTLLPNLTAMTLVTPRAATTVAVRVKNHLDTAALLGPQAQAELLRRICDRLSLAAGDARVFQVDEHSFAWRTTRSLEETIETVEGLNALFGGGIVVGDRALDVAVAIGICADQHLDIKTAVSAALLASDRAVRRGITWGRYEPDDDDEKWRLSVLADLGRAIEDGDIWVAYQPQGDLRTGKIIGAEALARWTHPTQGEMRPDQFIAVLEEDDRIHQLTMHVLRSAIRDFASFEDDLSLSVNISMRVIGRRNLAEPIRALLDEFGLPPSRLILEVTESAPILDPSHLDELRELREMGIMISIDDFGTGQSTLSYLKQLPATELKIDRSFVQLILSNRSDATMVDSTIKLAHALGLKVVAEGVENKEVYDKLAKMECDIVQGYYLSRPLTFDDFWTFYEHKLGTKKGRRVRA